jgi:hypothetical protein
MRATYRAVDEAPLAEGTIVVLETGETMDLAQILAIEQMRPQKVLVHKIGGRYVIAADGFANAYLVEQGRATKIPLGGRASGVTIKTAIASPCATLREGDRTLFIGTSGKTSFDRCPDEEAK